MPKHQVRGAWELALRIQPKNYGLVKALIIEAGLVDVMKEHWVSFPDNYVDPNETLPAKGKQPLPALPKPPASDKAPQIVGHAEKVYLALEVLNGKGKKEFTRKEIVALVPDIDPNYVNGILTKFIDYKFVKRVKQGLYKICELQRSAA